MLKQAKSPDGYKHLLVYRKAEELLAETLRLTCTFPIEKTLNDLEDQMNPVRGKTPKVSADIQAYRTSNGVNRSARSVKANIVEGWKRNATHEYYTFLGYAVASNEELLEDCLDICLGRYGEKGVNGGKGEKEMGEKGRERGGRGTREWLESLRFYPLDTTLPACVQLYLRTKEIRMLLDKLQSSLQTRMEEKKTLSEGDRVRLKAERGKKRQDDIDEWTKQEWKKLGIVMTGQGVKKETEAKHLGLSYWHYGEPER